MFTTLRNSCLITFKKMQKQPTRSSAKKLFLKFGNVHSKTPLLETFFLIQNIVKFFRASENVHQTKKK